MAARIALARLALVFAFAASAAALRAQMPAGVVSVKAGTPIRAYLNRLDGEAPSAILPRVDGDLAAVARDTIFLVNRQTGDTSWIPLRGLDHLEYSSGQHHPVARGGVVGGAIGLFLGGVAGFTRTWCREACYVVHAGRTKAEYVAGGAAIGFVGGLLTGSLITVESWHRAEPAIFAVHSTR